jgi:SET domain-containing protein
MLLMKIFKRKMIEQPAAIFVKQSAIHGRGVFTDKDIRPGELIENAPFILINDSESELLKQTNLHNYYFLVKNPAFPLAVGFGFSSLYNHACPSNAIYTIDLQSKIIVIKAFKFIHQLEEITINYNGHPEDYAAVSFTNPLII